VGGIVVCYSAVYADYKVLCAVEYIGHQGMTSAYYSTCGGTTDRQALVTGIYSRGCKIKYELIRRREDYLNKVQSYLYNTKYNGSSANVNNGPECVVPNCSRLATIVETQRIPYVYLDDHGGDRSNRWDFDRECTSAE
jgi:hypothetical protein